ncbi:MAG: hypothetical protein QGG36_10055 [Pirellulaceae bacterium]|nr:hypothetical protein [Pirellulaceae bacterium]MDP7016133.1 hypothetical protein [Pirellulaceae bacterium]
MTGGNQRRFRFLRISLRSLMLGMLDAKQLQRLNLTPPADGPALLQFRESVQRVRTALPECRIEVYE